MGFGVEVVGIEASSRSISSISCCGVRIWFSRVLVSSFHSWWFFIVDSLIKSQYEMNMCIIVFWLCGLRYDNNVVCWFMLDLGLNEVIMLHMNSNYDIYA